MRTLATSATQLVNAIKTQAAGEADGVEKSRLLAAARGLADATARMVTAAKDAARAPTDPNNEPRLRAAGDAVAVAVRQATGSDNRRKLFKKLALAAKQIAGVSTQLISAAKACSASNRNQASQIQLINASKQVAEQTAVLVASVRVFNDNPDDALGQLKVLNASKSVVSPANAIIAAAKAAAPTIGDVAAQSQLNNFAKQAAESLRKLKEALDAVEAVSGGLEIESALETLHAARGDLTSAQVQAQNGQLRPLPDQTAETAQFEVGAAAKTIGSSLAQLISAASQGNENYTSVAARDTAQALTVLAQAVKAVAATSNDPELQLQSLAGAIEVLNRAEPIIALAKAAKAQHADPNYQQQLATAATDINKAMTALVDTLPGYRDVARALAQMQADLQRLQGPVPPPGAGDSFQAASTRLIAATNATTMSATAAASAAKGTTTQLKGAAEDLRNKFAEIVAAGQAVLSQTNDPAVRADIVSNASGVLTAISRLMQACKALNADPNGPNLKNLVALTVKGVTDALQKLLSVCSAAAPGQKECDQATQLLDQALARLENVNDPNADNEGALPPAEQSRALLTAGPNCACAAPARHFPSVACVDAQTRTLPACARCSSSRRPSPPRSAACRRRAVRTTPSAWATPSSRRRRRCGRPAGPPAARSPPTDAAPGLRCRRRCLLAPPCGRPPAR